LRIFTTLGHIMQRSPSRRSTGARDLTKRYSVHPQVAVPLEE